MTAKRKQPKLTAKQIAQQKEGREQNCQYVLFHIEEIQAMEAPALQRLALIQHYLDSLHVMRWC
ncbi:MAG: hypothetical protein ACQCN3_00740 [Candidatus Bathyarchaeia archaeon]|jgi:hypothetical protein